MDALTCVVIPSLWQSSDWPSLHFPLFFNPLIVHVTCYISSTSLHWTPSSCGSWCTRDDVSIMHATRVDQSIVALPSDILSCADVDKELRRRCGGLESCVCGG
jgi:hypothetical protein